MTHDDKFKDDNPYAPPVEGAHVSTPFPIGASGAYVSQVRPLCICMIIQGVLEIVVGLGFVALGFVMQSFLQNLPGGPAGGPRMPAEQQEFVQMISLVMYGGGGFMTSMAGLVRIVAGVRGLSFRGHALGVTSHYLGLLSLFTFYCLPTSAALCIWGSIVYFNAGVKQAFRLGAEGHDAAEIEARMSGYHYR